MHRDVLCERRDVGAFDLRIVKIVEIVKNGDVMSACEEFFDQMRADESSAACYENSHEVNRQRRATGVRLGLVPRPDEPGAILAARAVG